MAQINGWLSIDKTSGSGNDSVTLTALQNNGDERTFKILVKGRFRKQYVGVRQKMDPTFIDRKYFWVEFEETGGVIENKIKNDEMDMYHSFDGFVWEQTPKTLSMGEYTKVYFKNNSLKLSNSNNIWQNEISFSKYASIGGNLGSITDMYDHCCFNLFCYNTFLRHAHDLIIPWVNVADSCFVNMFYGCTSLETAPELPSTTLASNCYSTMFSGCTSLEIAPSLPSTTLAEYCYRSMFRGCTSLEIAPKLPATTLASNCYDGMFMGCESLTTAPKLPAFILKKECYNNMFYGCHSFTTAPELPATILAEDCYYQMFGDCESLVNAPELPATILASHCYDGMFQNCISLATAPELPATILAEECYSYMFYGCTSLTTAPVLPATELTERCYYAMFGSCSSLSMVECHAEDISAEKCITRWLEDVSPTGTFIKKEEVTYPSGSSGIPNGWTIQEIS